MEEQLARYPRVKPQTNTQTKLNHNKKDSRRLFVDEWLTRFPVFEEQLMAPVKL
jgi:hypothetical protein